MAVAVVLLFATVLVITWMVFARALGFQTSWGLEASIEMTVVATFLAVPYTLYLNGHVRIEVLDRALESRLARAVNTVAIIIGVAVCLYLGWFALWAARDTYLANERTLGVLRLVVWPKYASMSFGLVLTAVQYFCGRRERP